MFQNILHDLEKREKREGMACLALVTGQMLSCAPALSASTDPSHTENVPVYLEMEATKAETHPLKRQVTRVTLCDKKQCARNVQGAQQVSAPSCPLPVTSGQCMVPAILPGTPMVPTGTTKAKTSSGN